MARDAQAEHALHREADEGGKDAPAVPPAQRVEKHMRTSVGSSSGRQRRETYVSKHTSAGRARMPPVVRDSLESSTSAAWNMSASGRAKRPSSVKSRKYAASIAAVPSSSATHWCAMNGAKVSSSKLTSTMKARPAECDDVRRARRAPLAFWAGGRGQAPCQSHTGRPSDEGIPPSRRSRPCHPPSARRAGRRGGSKARLRRAVAPFSTAAAQPRCGRTG